MRNDVTEPETAGHNVFSRYIVLTVSRDFSLLMCPRGGVIGGFCGNFFREAIEASMDGGFQDLYCLITLDDLEVGESNVSVKFLVALCVSPRDGLILKSRHFLSTEFKEKSMPTFRHQPRVRRGVAIASAVSVILGAQSVSVL